MSPSRSGRWSAVLLALLPAAVVLAQLAALGPMAIDDAYISYRYAANLAAGRGLVYNEGERVQGFSNPLYTLVLAAAGAAGVPIPAAATAVGVGSAAAAGIVLVFFLRGRTGRVAGAVAAVGLLLTPEFVLNTLSGMETALFSALLLGAAWAFDRGRWRCAGLLAGGLATTRPDGALWFLAPALFLLRTDRCALARAAGAAAIPWGAWLVFATIYYGNPVPHSLAAKRLVHPGGFLPILERHVRFLARDPALLAVGVLGGIALAGELRERTRLGAVALGGFAYLAGLAASGILPFEVPRYFLWYPVPLIPIGFLLAARAAERAGRALARRARAPVAAGVVALAPAVLALGAYRHLWERDLPAIRDHFAFRERGYEAVARAIREEAAGGPADILVGETGVVGFHLLGHRIHDSSGINSPEIFRLRREDRRQLAAAGVRPPALDEGSPRWVLRFLRERRPEYVTTVRLFLYLPVLEGIPAFNALYEPVAREEVWLGRGMIQHTLYGRRDRPRRRRPEG